ncbi:MAG: hypothetical protein GAK28_02526 [Luteibacter sp.]|uniref:hypothetical protein n=1 Tax=Luteibacter sp. TaxID=1886636 RepID=UPI001383DF26|nr:hypothetical protein [Luteibacter sp.]KAF1006508.1 MAG: hypothetical protein GAK28_02526 [Luteibacter sp.]
MTPRATFAGFFLLALVPVAGAKQAAPAKAAHAEAPAATHAKLDASRGQATAEGARVEKLKARVDALEADSHAASKQLDERDRKIAELQRELNAGGHP